MSDNINDVNGTKEESQEQPQSNEVKNEEAKEVKKSESIDEIIAAKAEKNNNDKDKDKKKNVIERETIYPDPDSVQGDDYLGATIHIKNIGQSGVFNVNGNEVKRNDNVIVETRNGVCFGKVIQQVRKVDLKKREYVPYRVLRKATSQDEAQQIDVEKKEEIAFNYCSERASAHKLQMKLVRVQYLHHGKKAIFFFTADGRVDFRELIKDLVKELKIRIEMRQIGVRDEAKYLGGYGPCGRELCCSTFLKNFAPVSIKMAKDQNIALNPTKVSGTCGRLQCCLAYEEDMYNDLRRELPAIGTIVVFEGKDYIVESQLPLSGKLTVRGKEDHALITIHHSETKSTNERIVVKQEVDAELISALKEMEKMDSKEAEMREMQERLEAEKAGLAPPAPRNNRNFGNRQGGFNRDRNNNRDGQQGGNRDNRSSGSFDRKKSFGNNRPQNQNGPRRDTRDNRNNNQVSNQGAPQNQAQNQGQGAGSNAQPTPNRPKIILKPKDQETKDKSNNQNDKN